MRNKRLGLIIAGVLGVLILLVVLAGSFRSQPRVTPASEPERGGGSSIVITNTEKLNAVLPPAQFFAVKDMLGDYIQDRLGRDITASVEDTTLNADGSIGLLVDVKGKQFKARAYEQGGYTYFEVPSNNYQARRSQMEVNDQYQGLPNE